MIMQFASVFIIWNNYWFKMNSINYSFQWFSILQPQKCNPWKGFLKKCGYSTTVIFTLYKLPPILNKVNIFSLNYNMILIHVHNKLFIYTLLKVVMVLRTIEQSKLYYINKYAQEIIPVQDCVHAPFMMKLIICFVNIHLA